MEEEFPEIPVTDEEVATELAKLKYELIGQDPPPDINDLNKNAAGYGQARPGRVNTWLRKHNRL